MGIPIMTSIEMTQYGYKGGDPYANDTMTYVETGARFKCCRLIGQLHLRRANRNKRKQAATGSVDGEYLIFR